ncbi:HNH endonuclease [Pseudanabaena minima]|uniref:HNH endonuclease n=1 Tax=Pseudanabaena minima TaxID=890415 RepID=UPI003DA9B9CF
MNSFNLPLIQGESSPQYGIPENMNAEEMLLYAAWLHGIKLDSVVHRLAIFSFIQSHIANKGDESLQTVVEKSIFWQGIGEGYYKLTVAGDKEVKLRFGVNLRPAEFGYEYSFLRRYREREIKIIVNVISRKLMPFIDNQAITGVEANRILSNLGVNLPKAGTSQPRKVLNWILQNNDYIWSVKYADLPKANDNDIVKVTSPDHVDENFDSVVPDPTPFKEDDDELVFPEGKEVYRLHRSKERNKSVINLAKKRAKDSDPLLCCSVCDFSFSKAYGAIGEDFIEAHHTKPLSEITEEIETKVEDIALVCSNCHKMIHRKRPWLSISDLEAILKSK